MADRKGTVRDPSGREFSGTVVGVEESNERFSDVHLKDGTRLRIKPVVTEALRIDGAWDNEGHPAYIVKSTNVVVVDESDAEYRKKVQ